jgi:hypothetical protein
MNYLDNQIAVVSGASGGIGGASPLPLPGRERLYAFSAATQLSSRRPRRFSVHPPHASISKLAI